MTVVEPVLLSGFSGGENEKNNSALLLSVFFSKAVDSADMIKQNAGLPGGVPEWPKGSDCKSDGSAFGGSNPPPSTNFMALW